MRSQVDDILAHHLPRQALVARGGMGQREITHRRHLGRCGQKHLYELLSQQFPFTPLFLPFLSQSSLEGHRKPIVVRYPLVILSSTFSIQHTWDRQSISRRWSQLLCRQRFAFVLRIWIEQDTCDAGERPMLRGSVQQVDGDRMRYFNSFDQVVEILREAVGWMESSTINPLENQQGGR